MAARRSDFTRSQLRTLLIEAGAEVVLERFRHSHTASAVAVPLRDVVARANDIFEQRQGHPPSPKFTDGALYGIWPDGKSAFFRSVLAAILGPDHVDAQGSLVAEGLRSLAAGAKPETVRADMARRDLTTMVEEDDGGWSRLWFFCLSLASERDMSDVIAGVYAGFDRDLLPLYEAELQVRGRVPREGFSIEDIALALTACTEGLAMRAIGDRQVAERHLMGDSARPGIAEIMSEAVFSALTESEKGHGPPSGLDHNRPEPKSPN